MVTLFLCSTWVSPMGCCLFPADPIWVSHRLQFSRHCSNVGLYHRTYPSRTAHMDPQAAALPTLMSHRGLQHWLRASFCGGSAWATAFFSHIHCCTVFPFLNLLSQSTSSIAHASALSAEDPFWSSWNCSNLTQGSAGTAHRGHFCSALLPTS